ncbi:MAG TPA: glycosyltransferase [Pyrinomonadaceae bacterium]|nr:glycosyltransferase [Pyrinomonadaceae bacterium]
MKLSVLICTYNRPELLAQCLDALLCRTTERPDQVVVVNGGDERTDEVVRQSAKAAGQEIEIKLIKTVNKNLAASRNVGLPHCTGEIIAMTDDDAEVFPDWVTQMKRLHAEHPKAGAVGGMIIGADSDSFISRLADRVTFSSPPNPRIVRTLPGVNVSYKRAVIDRIGPQDETLFRGEDVDYNWQVKRLGYEIYYDPSVRVEHHHRPSLRAFLNQHYMYGRAYYLVRRKWPEMYCIYPHALRRPKDFLKVLNFFAAPFYEPFQYAARLERIADRLPAYPILLANQLAWRGGMCREMLAGNRTESRPSHR